MTTVQLPRLGASPLGAKFAVARSACTLSSTLHALKLRAGTLRSSYPTTSHRHVACHGRASAPDRHSPLPSAIAPTFSGHSRLGGGSNSQVTPSSVIALVRAKFF